MRHRLFVAAFALLVWGCASTTPASETAGGSSMSPAEAQAFIAKVQTERGNPPPPSTPVSSMDELFAIMEGDEIGRFEAAAGFVAGKPGIDAMALHATIELLWSDAFSTVARVLEELQKRAEV